MTMCLIFEIALVTWTVTSDITTHTLSLFSKHRSVWSTSLRTVAGFEFFLQERALHI